MRPIYNRDASSPSAQCGIIVPRPRVVELIARANHRPIALLVAAAGYGKSFALREFLDAHAEASIALDACEGFELQRVPSGFAGTIVVDSLERADRASVASLVECIERSSAQTRWIVASRSSVGLPIGTWLAAGRCDLPIAANDLRFDVAELDEALARAGVASERETLANIESLTEGWPASVSVAVRALTHSGDRRDLGALVRDAAWSYLAEQVYCGLSQAERELLSVAAVSPRIGVTALEAAGFPTALRTLDEIRRRTGILDEPRDRVFSMPGFIREFLRRQIVLAGSDWQVAVHLRAARALEATGDAEGALDAYVVARSQPELRATLESRGFDLLERGRSDCVARAVDALDDLTRNTSPRILALRGVLQSLAGKPTRAETFLRRALLHAGHDRDAHAVATFRLALILTNRGVDVSDLLLPIADDRRQSRTRRSEALSLLAARYALGGEPSKAGRAKAQSAALLAKVDDDAARAKILQRLGVAAVYSGDFEDARANLTQSAELALELQMFSLASRAYANLSNLALHNLDDIEWQRWYAEQAARAAEKAGDAFDVETSLLQLMDAELRCGNRESSTAIDAKLSGVRAGDQSRTHYLVPSRALRLAWDGRFAEAHRALEPCWRKLHHKIDRIVSGAQCALFLALDAKRAASSAAAREARDLVDCVDSSSLFSARSVATAVAYCAVAESLNGKISHAERAARRIGFGFDDPVVSLVAEATVAVVSSVRNGRHNGDREIEVLLEKLTPLGYAHFSKLLNSVLKAVREANKDAGHDPLTVTERDIMRLLADGLSPKEIAGSRGCSVNTIRTHVANVITKLRCNGRVQAIALSRKAGILD